MLFRERLKELREKKGMTQSSLAEAAGVSAAAVKGFERGARFPTFAVVQLLSIALDVELGGWSDLEIETSSKTLVAKKPKKSKKDEE